MKVELFSRKSLNISIFIFFFISLSFSDPLSPSVFIYNISTSLIFFFPPPRHVRRGEGNNRGPRPGWWMTPRLSHSGQSNKPRARPYFTVFLRSTNLPLRHRRRRRRHRILFASKYRRRSRPNIPPSSAAAVSARRFRPIYARSLWNFLISPISFESRDRPNSRSIIFGWLKFANGSRDSTKHRV